MSSAASVAVHIQYCTGYKARFDALSSALLAEFNGDDFSTSIHLTAEAVSTPVFEVFVSDTLIHSTASGQGWPDLSHISAQISHASLLAARLAPAYSRGPSRGAPPAPAASFFATPGPRNRCVSQDEPSLAISGSAGPSLSLYDTQQQQHQQQRQRSAPGQAAPPMGQAALLGRLSTPRRTASSSLAAPALATPGLGPVPGGLLSPQEAEADAFLRARARDRAVEDALAARAMLRDRGALGGYSTAEAAVADYARTRTPGNAAAPAAAGAATAAGADPDTPTGFHVRPDGIIMVDPAAPPPRFARATDADADAAATLAAAAAAAAEEGADGDPTAAAVVLAGSVAGAGAATPIRELPLTGTDPVAAALAAKNSRVAAESGGDPRSTPFAPMQHLRVAVEWPCVSCTLGFFALAVLWVVVLILGSTTPSFVSFVWTDFPLEIDSWNNDGGYFRSQAVRAAEKSNNVRLEYISPSVLVRSSVERDLEVIYSAVEGNVFNMAQLTKINTLETEIRADPNFQRFCLLDWPTVTNGGFLYNPDGSCLLSDDGFALQGAEANQLFSRYLSAAAALNVNDSAIAFVLNQTLANIDFYNEQLAHTVPCAWQKGVLIPSITIVDEAPSGNFSTHSVSHSSGASLNGSRFATQAFYTGSTVRTPSAGDAPEDALGRRPVNPPPRLYRRSSRTTAHEHGSGSQSQRGLHPSRVTRSGFVERPLASMPPAALARAYRSIAVGPRDMTLDEFNDPGTCAPYLEPVPGDLDPSTCTDGICHPMGLLTQSGALMEHIKNKRLDLYASVENLVEWDTLVDMTFGSGNPTGRALRSTFSLAVPLAGKAPTIPVQREEQKEIEKYVVRDFLDRIIKSEDFFSPSVSVTFEAIRSGALEGLFAEELVISSPLLIASIVAVWLGTAILLRSTVLATAAMLLFLGAIAPVYLLYRAMGYTYVGLFHLVGVVVTMYVGHFLIIVYMNRWDQAERLYAPIPILARSGRLQLGSAPASAAAGGESGSGVYDYDDDDDEFLNRRASEAADTAADESARRQRARAEYIAAITADALRPLEASKRYMPSWIWRRLSWTFRSASFTLLLCTASLALSLVVNVSLSLPAFRALTLFTALLAVINLILILFLWPSAITCHHKYLYDRRCCICFRPYRKDINLARLQGLEGAGGAGSSSALLGVGASAGGDSSGGAGGVGGGVAGGGSGGSDGGEFARLSQTEAFCHTRMLVFLIKNRFPVLICFLLSMALMVWYASHIKIDNRNVTSTIFIDSHPINSFSTAIALFRFGSSIKLDFSFGLDAYRPVDRSGANAMDPLSFGTPVWSDFTTPTGGVDLYLMRNCLLDFCSALSSANDRLQMLAGAGTSRPVCLVSDLSEWISTGPVSRFGLTNYPGGLRNISLTSDEFRRFYLTFVALENDYCVENGIKVSCYDKYRDYVVLHQTNAEDFDALGALADLATDPTPGARPGERLEALQTVTPGALNLNDITTRLLTVSAKLAQSSTMNYHAGQRLFWVWEAFVTSFLGPLSPSMSCANYSAPYDPSKNGNSSVYFTDLFESVSRYLPPDVRITPRGSSSSSLPDTIKSAAWTPPTAAQSGYAPRGKSDRDITFTEIAGHVGPLPGQSTDAVGTHTGFQLGGVTAWDPWHFYFFLGAMGHELLLGSVFAVVLVVATSLVLTGHIFATILVTFFVLSVITFLVGLITALDYNAGLVTTVPILVMPGVAAIQFLLITEGYLSSQAFNPMDRVRETLTKNGYGVIFGTVVTLIPTLFLFLSSAAIFRTFAIVYFLTMIYIVVTALVLIPVALLTLGPSSSWSNIYSCIGATRCWRKRCAGRSYTDILQSTFCCSCCCCVGNDDNDGKEPGCARCCCFTGPAAAAPGPDDAPWFGDDDIPAAPQRRRRPVAHSSAVEMALRGMPANVEPLPAEELQAVARMRVEQAVRVKQSDLENPGAAHTKDMVRDRVYEVQREERAAAAADAPAVRNGDGDGDNDHDVPAAGGAALKGVTGAGWWSLGYGDASGHGVGSRAGKEHDLGERGVLRTDDPDDMYVDLGK